MSNFQKLAQIKDVRHSLTRKGSYINDGINAKTDIAIHHALVPQTAAGANAEGYARYHVNTLGWPGIGYHFIIETDGTIKWCNEVGARSYHVGNSNRFAIGICVTGDFRTEKLTKAQEDSLALLVNALKKDMPNYKRTRGHNEFPGYSWKACPEFDYRAVITKQVEVAPVKAATLPNQYVTQEGDTFWSIANELKDVSVDDLLKANPSVKPTELRVGMAINLAEAKKVVVAPEVKGVQVEVHTKRTLSLKNPFMRGEDVKVVQQAVGASADGLFGHGTDRLVRAYQRQNNLTADGIVGRKTWALIDRGVKVRSKPALNRLLRLQTPLMRGDDIRFLQTRLGVVTDGLYGMQTERAVRDFQRAEKIKVDGIVGQQTWRRL